MVRGLADSAGLCGTSLSPAVNSCMCKSHRLAHTLAARPPSCRWNAQRDEQGKWTYEGWQRAVAAIEEALRQHGPFDGLMGFSQVRCSVLCAVRCAAVHLQGPNPAVSSN